MPFRYSSYPHGTRAVPSQLARQLLEQRNRLAEELQEARRENERLRARREADARLAEQHEARAGRADEEIQQLRERLARFEEAAAEREDRAASAVAPLNRRVRELTEDFERLQRQSARAVDDARREERARLLAGLGGVLDSVERALSMNAPGAGGAGGDEAWRQGLEAIRGQLHAFMRAQGATVIGQVGEALDPRVHEAIAVVDAPDFESGQIVHVERPGIELAEGQVVRSAQVVVAR